nr:uncharacterized protein LOC123760820 [Procambarus clarkii]
MMMRTSSCCCGSRSLSPVLIISLLVTSINGMCDLPSQWRGGWFQSGVRDIISITRTEFSSKGVCVHSSGEKFLFKDSVRPRSAYRATQSFTKDKIANELFKDVDESDIDDSDIDEDYTQPEEIETTDNEGDKMSEMDFFTAYFNETLMEHIVHKTNRFAADLIEGPLSSLRAKDESDSDVDSEFVETETAGEVELEREGNADFEPTTATGTRGHTATLCEPSRDLASLCAQITGDALLFSMFRRDAPPAACPFKGPLTFSYTRGHGQCSVPASTIDSCTSDSRLLFKYQACPDVQGTESSVEEVECIGHWKEGSTRYFVGQLEASRALTDEDRYRCFAWERAREAEDNIDYRMAQSGDATCNGVFSAYDGSKTMRIKKAGSYGGCEFPSWVSSHRRWHALDRGASYSVGHHNTTLRLHHAHNSRTQPTQLGIIQEEEEEAGETERTKVNYAGTEARLVCSQQREATSSRVVLVTHLTTGCSSGYVCTVLYRRDGHIIEMQQGSRAIRAADACHSMYFNDSTASHTTLTSKSK